MADDPANGGNWGPDRQVRAQLLVELLTGRTGPTTARPRALKLAGARIAGTLDLEATVLICPLIMRGCYFEEAVNLNEAQAPAVRLPGCRLPGLTAKQHKPVAAWNLTVGSPPPARSTSAPLASAAT